MGERTQRAQAVRRGAFWRDATGSPGRLPMFGAEDPPLGPHHQQLRRGCTGLRPAPGAQQTLLGPGPGTQSTRTSPPPQTKWNSETSPAPFRKPPCLLQRPQSLSPVCVVLFRQPPSQETTLRSALRRTPRRAPWAGKAGATVNGRMDGRTDGRADGQADGWTGARMDGRLTAGGAGVEVGIGPSICRCGGRPGTPSRPWARAW